MKKLLFFLCLTLVTQVPLRSQTFDKGTSVVTVGYGVPNLITLTFRAIYKISDHTNYSFSAMGPILLRYEYGITKNIGIGLAGGYTTASVAYTFKDWNVTKTEKIDYTAKITWKSPSVGPRLNIHFGTNDKVDPYFGVGAGWSGQTFTYTDSSPWEDSYPKLGTSSFYFNLGIGFRYYFTENIGLYAEAGWDKAALFQLGLAGRF